jgi:hypothetical protein
MNRRPLGGKSLDGLARAVSKETIDVDVHYLILNMLSAHVKSG